MKKIFYLFILSNLISCVSDPIEKNEIIVTPPSSIKNFDFVKVDSLLLNDVYGTDKNKYFFISTIPFTDLIAAYDGENQYIDIFDFEKKIIVERIDLSKQSFLYKHPPREFQIDINKNFTFFSPGGFISKYDYSGEKFMVHDLNGMSYKTKDFFGVDPLNNDKSILTINNRNFIRSFPSKLSWVNDYEYYEKPAFIELDSNFNLIRPHYVFPDFLKNAKYFPNDYRFSTAVSLDNSNLIISFRRAHNIYLYDPVEEKSIPVYGKSEFLNKFDLIDRKDNSQIETNILTSKGIYHKILGPSSNSKYFRIATHDQPLKNKEGLMNNAAYKDFSVIVFDSKLQMEGEAQFKLDGKRISYTDIIQFQNGLILLNRDNVGTTPLMYYYEIY